MSGVEHRSFAELRSAFFLALPNPTGDTIDREESKKQLEEAKYLVSAMRGRAYADRDINKLMTVHTCAHELNIIAGALQAMQTPKGGLVLAGGA